jgi:hypothetical protein
MDTSLSPHSILNNELQQFPVQSIQSLLELISCPEHLRCLGRICVNMLPILDMLHDILIFNNCKDEGVEPELLINIPIWKQICAEIVDRQHFLAKIIPGFSDVPGVNYVEAPLKNDYGSHCLYVALWYRVEYTELAKRYNQLQAQFLLCEQWTRFLKERYSYKYTCSRESAFRRLRQLSRSINKEELGKFPADTITLHYFYETVTTLSDTDQHFAKKFSCFLKYAYKRKPGVQHKRNPDGQNDYDDITEGTSLTLDSDSEEDKRSKTRILKEINRHVSTNTIRGTHASAREFGSSHEVGEQENPTSEDRKRNSPHRLAQNIARQNQLLSDRWDVLNQYDIEKLLDAIASLVGKKIKNESKISGLEMAAFMSVMFWASSSRAEVAKFKYHHKMSELDRDTKRGFQVPTKTRKESNWLIMPPTSDVYWKSPVSFHAEHTQKVLYLPVPESVAGIINRYIEEQRAKDGNTSTLLFIKESQIYRNTVKQFLLKINHEYGTRLNEERIIGYLFDSLLYQAGTDIVSAMMITGRTHYTGMVPLFYTHIPTSTLRHQYQTICETILTLQTMSVTNLSGEIHYSAATSPIPRTGNSGVGSKVCPRQSTVQSVAAKLLKTLRQAVAVYTGNSDEDLRHLLQELLHVIGNPSSVKVRIGNLLKKMQAYEVVTSQPFHDLLRLSTTSLSVADRSVGATSSFQVVIDGLNKSPEILFKIFCKSVA